MQFDHTREAELLSDQLERRILDPSATCSRYDDRPDAMAQPQ
jgi:hypothetical protein